MANTQSAKKRIRSNARKAQQNKMVKTRVRSAVRDARAALDSENNAESKTALMKAISELDRAANKGVIHKGNASRRKSRLMKKMAALTASK